MSHNVLSLILERFDSRIVFGGCLLNINGETFDCTVTRPDGISRSPTYTVTYEEGGEKKTITFRPYHLDRGPIWYTIEWASQCMGDATLMVPRHGMLPLFMEDENE